MNILIVIKGLVRVKTEDSPQATHLLQKDPSQIAAQACQHQCNTAGCLKAWAIEDLPRGCNADDTFKLVASPTYLQMLGHNKMPFGMPDEEDLKGMQAIFNYIYQSLQEYTIKVGSNCLVFGMVYCHYSGVYNCLIMYLVPFWCQQPSQYLR